MADGRDIASDLRFLERAARLALRGHGGAEPNPMVGCVIVARDGSIAGEGYHRRCGGPHAEVAALRVAGARARGGTAYVTLEPCNRTGRTGPCTEALIEAGVARIVAAQRDPCASAEDSAERLREAGVEVVFENGCLAAAAVSAPFRHHVETGRPWVIAKWAQTIDGRVASRAGESQWISGPRSRRLVHRERGRVDAILTGIGTVRSDDPMLTARGVRRRRVARRVVIDPALEIPAGARLVATAAETPTVIVTGRDRIASAHGRILGERGVELLGAEVNGGELDLAAALAALARGFDIRTVLVESGPGLLGRLFRGGLVNEAWVFVGPLLLGDREAPGAVDGLGLAPAPLAGATRLVPVAIHRRGDDVLIRYVAGV